MGLFHCLLFVAVWPGAVSHRTNLTRWLEASVHLAQCWAHHSADKYVLIDSVSIEVLSKCKVHSIS